MVKRNRNKPKEKFITYTEIPMQKKKYINRETFSSNFEIIKVIQGVFINKEVKFKILIRNLNTNNYSFAKLSNKNLKYINPLLLCEYYEKHIVDLN